MSSRPASDHRWAPRGCRNIRLPQRSHYRERRSCASIPGECESSRLSNHRLALAPDLGEERESETTAHSWEVALVLKKYMDVGSHVRAYADAGFSGRHTSGTTHTQGFILQLKTTPGPPGPPPVMRTMPFSYDGSPPELKRDWVGGFLLGGGLALKYRFVGLQPELRYTRWSAETFRRSVSPNQSLRSNKNSLDVLFGVTFRR